MPRGTGEEPRLTYLAEQYHPGLAVEMLERLAAQVRESIAELALEGKQVRYLRATIVPRDESFLLVVEAASEGLVREAYARAGVRFDRISTTLERGLASSPRAALRRRRPGRRRPQIPRRRPGVIWSDQKEEP
jgi:hypothetical protein